MYQVQYFDTDSESWVDDEDYAPTSDKADAEDDAREARRKCAYPIKTRVVEV